MDLLSRTRTRVAAALVATAAVGGGAVAQIGHSAPHEFFSQCKSPPSPRGGGPHARDFERLPAVAHAMRASQARADYVASGFDALSDRFVIAVENHNHDEAIRDCAEKLGLEDLAIEVRRFRPSDINRASDQLYRQVPTLRRFISTYSNARDALLLQIHHAPTRAQRTRILAAADRTGVPYELLPDDPSRFTTLARVDPIGTTRNVRWGVTGAGADGRSLRVAVLGTFGTCDGDHRITVRESPTTITIRVRKRVNDSCPNLVGISYRAQAVQLRAPIAGRKITGAGKAKSRFSLPLLIIADTPETMPKLVGLRRSDAITVLRSQRFPLTRIKSDPAKPGAVLTQTPAAGSVISRSFQGTPTQAVRLTTAD